jgi:methylase of polypeptide subunit release factors
LLQYKTVSYGSIDVCYLDELDGGGARFGQDYLSLIPRLGEEAGRALEWCAGPAFIGFAMLAAGLCKSLTLVDINPVATAACRQTVANNNLANQVRVYDSDCFDELPKGDKFDLIIANPPHCGTANDSPGGHSSLLYNDVGWQVHKKFYRQVPEYATATTRIILQEDAELSNAEDFREIIESAGLEVRGSSRCVWARDYYYIESGLPVTQQGLALWKTRNWRVDRT